MTKEKNMRKELIKNQKSGGEYFSFVYYNSYDKRRIRLSRDYIRARFGKDITDEDEAEKILEILGQELHSLSHEKDQRLTLKAEEYEFSHLLSIYEEAQTKAAPFSVKNNLHYLKYYVLHYFLRVKECKELGTWHLYYEDFKAWLEDSAFLLKKPDQIIAYASKNHAIRALNTFMRHMHKKRFIPILHICPQFPSHLLKEKSVDEIVPPNEMERICKAFLGKGDKELAVFYRLLFFTGLRFNEARGLALENVFPGEIENETLQRRLVDNKITYFGYLVVHSQPFDRYGPRDEAGNVKRKPLKGRRKIDEKSSRVVPITDKLLWKQLVEIHNRLLPEFKKKVFGDNLANYLFFNEINQNSLTKLARVCSTLNVPYRSWHALRHTRATYLIGETGDVVLARLWLGHKKQEVLEKYVHVYQAIVRSAKKVKDKELSPILLE